MTVFLSGCVYAGKFAIQFRASLNLDLAYHRGEPLFPASPRSPRISGQVFSKLASRCSPRSSTPPMRCWASGHLGAAPNEVNASRSRSVGGSETWLTRPFAAAMARRSKEAVRCPRGSGETYERIRQDRRCVSLDSCHDVSYLAGQVKVDKVEPRIRAFEYYDPQARAGVHPSQQILETFEYRGVYNVERRIFEQNPPVRRRFLDDPHVRRYLSHDSLSLP